MVLEAVGRPLVLSDTPDPQPRAGELLIRVAACAACRTDLHIVDGELPDPRLPLILGHQIVGTVIAAGPDVDPPRVGSRVGVPWLGWTCGRCRFCLSGRENLCDRAHFTGYHRDGGFAELATADARFAFKLPAEPDDLHIAPWLCGGLIGYRSLRLAGDPARVGVYGFGSAAHLVTQVARFEGRTVFAFTRPGDDEGQRFARETGAAWAGASTELPPEPLDAAIVFAPVGALVPAALRAVDKGGTVVCGGIHMSDIPSFPYSALWEERTVRSVANLTRRDAEEFLALAPKIPIRTHVVRFGLAQTNEALDAIRTGTVRGTAVVAVGRS
jgi:propanol-preferring alcohol dehydrogenase